MAKMTKIDQRVAWLKSHKRAIEKSRTKIIPSSKGGRNAATWKGMSGGGWGYWAQALRKAGIKSDSMSYWSGSAPTPSTAINRGIANYISTHAPKEIK